MSRSSFRGVLGFLIAYHSSTSDARVSNDLICCEISEYRVTSCNRVQILLFVATKKQINTIIMLFKEVLILRFALTVACVLLLALCVCSRRNKHRFRQNRECGMRRIIHTHITHGLLAAPKEWPFYVWLKIDVRETQDWKLCGGVLISKTEVLTNAHCLKGAKNVEIVLRDTNWSETEGTETVVPVNDYCVSKYYDDYPKIGWAVLYIHPDHSIVFDDYAQAACLPCAHGPDMPGPNTPCWVMGFGMNKTVGGATFPLRLNHLQVRPVACPNGVGADNRIHTCYRSIANFGDACKGDAGGPVLCLLHNRWTVMAIVTDGSAKCDGALPYGWNGLYIDVAKALRGIRKDCKLSV